MWLRGYLVFFSSLITSHSISITYHLKYPNSLLPTRLSPSLSYVFNQKTKKTETHTLTQCHFLFSLPFFFFSFSPDSHLSLPLNALILHSLTHCWDSSSKRFHGHWHWKRALLASPQQNSKLSHHFRPGLIYLLLSDIVFLTHMHVPNPGFPDTHFMRQNPHEPSHY